MRVYGCVLAPLHSFHLTMKDVKTFFSPLDQYHCPSLGEVPFKNPAFLTRLIKKVRLRCIALPPDRGINTAPLIGLGDVQDSGLILQSPPSHDRKTQPLRLPAVSPFPTFLSLFFFPCRSAVRVKFLMDPL